MTMISLYEFIDSSFVKLLSKKLESAKIILNLNSRGQTNTKQGLTKDFFVLFLKCIKFYFNFTFCLSSLNIFSV